MNSILSLSPTDNRCFSAEIASALEDINGAVIIQQLHYWMGKENVGVIVDGIKYIYNSFPAWVQNQFKWLTSWQFRKSMTLLRNLGIVKVIRYKARQWNQTNYYTLDYDVLFNYLKEKLPESPEISELCVPTDRDEEFPTLEVRDSNISYIDTENTSLKETAEQAAAEHKNSFSRGENGEEDKSTHQRELKGEKEDLKQESTGNKKDIGVDFSSAQDKLKIKNKKTGRLGEKETRGKASKFHPVTKSPRPQVLPNPDWTLPREDIDSFGLQLNSTVLRLIKEYSSEEVERAIDLLKLRKRDNYIPNPTGYFVQALKENWSSASSAVSEKDKFRYWYSLAKELGHVTGSEIRDNEQWVCFTGTWLKWLDVVEKGYTVEYLNKVLNRSKNR